MYQRRAPAFFSRQHANHRRRRRRRRRRPSFMSLVVSS